MGTLQFVWISGGCIGDLAWQRARFTTPIKIPCSKLSIAQEIYTTPVRGNCCCWHSLTGLSILSQWHCVCRPFEAAMPPPPHVHPARLVVNKPDLLPLDSAPATCRCPPSSCPIHTDLHQNYQSSGRHCRCACCLPLTWLLTLLLAWLHVSAPNHLFSCSSCIARLTEAVWQWHTRKCCCSSSRASLPKASTSSIALRGASRLIQTGMASHQRVWRHFA